MVKKKENKVKTLSYSEINKPIEEMRDSVLRKVVMGSLRGAAEIVKPVTNKSLELLRGIIDMPIELVDKENGIGIICEIGAIGYNKKTNACAAEATILSIIDRTDDENTHSSASKHPVVLMPYPPATTYSLGSMVDDILSAIDFHTEYNKALRQKYGKDVKFFS